MPLILRVDVDKPFGHSSLINKVKSKVSEDYWFPKGGPLNGNYLYHLEEFLQVCNREHVPGYIYFRICTAPDSKIKQLLTSGKHKAGVHAENTRDFESFQKEIAKLEEVSGLKFDSFTKHGSGNLKLGRYHYSPYEPEKYKEWSEKLKLHFYFGNGISTSSSDFQGKDRFWPDMFWVEPEYRDKDFNSLADVITRAKTTIVPVLIHPCNFMTYPAVRKDFEELIRLSKEAGVDWVLL